MHIKLIFTFICVKLTFFLLFESGALNIALGILELTMQTRLIEINFQGIISSLKLLI